jgi:hypothetical protein
MKKGALSPYYQRELVSMVIELEAGIYYRHQKCTKGSENNISKSKL